MMSLILLHSMVQLAHAADVIVVQTGQMFLKDAMIPKAAEIQGNPALGREHVIKTLKLKRGDRVTFKNMDKVTHNVYGDAFDLHAQTPGSEATQTFDTAGKQTVHCAIHPKMKFDVEVEP